mgnify:CR=1 FL=1
MNFDWVTPLYWKLEAAGTKALARYVPPGASVVELGARDGKHLHYLPRGVGAVMVSIAPDVDKGAARVSQAAQQALVFDCSTSTHAEGGTGAVDTGLPSSAYEVAFSIGALGRAEKVGGRAAVNEGVREAMRLLQPGGRLVFCERDDCAGAGASAENEPELVSLLRGTPGFVAVQAEDDGGVSKNVALALVTLLNAGVVLAMLGAAAPKRQRTEETAAAALLSLEPARLRAGRSAQSWRRTFGTASRLAST